MWWLVCGVLGIFGLLGGLALSPAGSVMALAISVGWGGALVGGACRLCLEPWPETGVGRAVLRSSGLGAVAALGVVLPFLVCGWLWFAGALLLGLTSPPCVRWWRSHWRERTVSDEPAGIEAEQWAAWVLSGRALEHPLSVADAAGLVDARQQMLDEIVTRHGSIPGGLWPTSHGPPVSE